MLERIRSSVIRIQEIVHNDRLGYAPQSPSGIVAMLMIDERDPSQMVVTYAGGLKKIDYGEETPVFEVFNGYTDQIQKENIRQGDFVRIDQKKRKVHRVGTPAEIMERWGVDVTELVGWEPPTKVSP